MTTQGPDITGWEGQLSELPVEEYLCARIRRAEQALAAHHQAALRGHGLTLTQYGVMLALSRRGGMSGAQLARSAGVTQQTMAGVLAGLQSKQLVDRRRASVHAKVQVASLTPRGQEILEHAHREVSELERSLARSFNYEEYRSICDLLERATEVLAAQTAPVRSRRADRRSPGLSP